MLLVILSTVLITLAVGCFAVVVLHAFGRSLGTGVMVLGIPFYQVVYGFSQFEHRYKGLVLAGWLGAGPLGIVLKTLALSLG
jgi:hypothetical protein